MHRTLSLALTPHNLLRHNNRPLARKLDDRPDAVGVAEQQVNLLEVAAHGLGEEEVHHDRHGACNDGKYDVVLPSDGVNGHGSDHDDDEVPVWGVVSG